MPRIIAALVVVLATTSSMASAQAERPEPTLEEGLGRVPHDAGPSSAAQDVVDPTAPLLQIAMRLEWDPSHHGEESAAGVALLVRPTLPFTAWGVPNLMRVSVPYEIETPENTQGLGTVEIFDLLVVAMGPGRFGIGPVSRWSPNDGEGGRFRIGPAIGYVARVGPATLGVLTRTLIGGSHGVSSLQPIAAITLAPWISVGVGEIELEWRWDESAWTSLPLGLAVDLIADLDGQFVRFGINPQYNPHDVHGLFEWRIATNVALLAR